jgi:RNA polymerase sigma-70 factor (sigma-E family)
MTKVDFQSYAAGDTARLLKLAYLLTGNAHTAEDLVQETLLRSHRHWRRISAMARPDAYVRRILVNQHHSLRRRRSSHELATAPDQLPAEATPDSQDWLATRDVMRMALRQLPRRQRTVLVLRYYEGLSDSEIAELLDCSLGNVRSLASRAIARLREHPDLADFGAPTVAYGEES